MSTLRVDTIQDRVGTGQPDIDGVAKAWVNFNGTGTVAIRASFNVTSITDSGTGDYTVNFTTAFSDANYSFTMGYVPDGIFASSAYARQFQAQTISTSSIRVRALNQDGSGGNPLDYPYLCVAIHR